MIATALLAATAVGSTGYVVSLERGRATPALAVTMTLVGDRDGETDIDLPTNWAGSDELWRAIGAPTIVGGRLQTDASPKQWRIRHAPGAWLTIRYKVRGGLAGPPDAATYEKARPAIEREWLYIHNEGAIAVPAGRGDLPAQFSIGPTPRGWRLASDLERVGGRTLTANDVGGGVIIGGTALRMMTRRVGAATLRVAVLGRWQFPDANLADRAARLMITENAMLGANAIDYFVPLAPLTGASTGAISFGGSGRTAGFALTSTDNVPIDDISRLLAHEYAHRWFGRGFGPVADGAGPYWFTEGVNDWFAGRAMVRAGLWTRAQWIKALNVLLLRYGASSARYLSDAQLTEHFWTNPDAMQVQYDRGNLIALLLDRALADRGGVMPILRRMRMERSRDDEIERFARLTHATAPGSLATAKRAAAAALDPDALAPCGRIVAVTQPAYDRRFDANAARIVTVASGNAAAAGVRPGMRYIRRIATAYGNSAVPFEAEFEGGGVRRILKWLPEGDTRVTFQQLRPTTLDSAACGLLVAGNDPAA